MTTPTRRKRKKEDRAPQDPALISPPSDTTESDSTADRDQFDFDRGVVDAVNRDLWAAIFDGHFRLAVKCRRCGRWLTDGRSKRNHMGPRCAQAAK